MSKDVASGDRIVVAVSGGLDSCVLLHLLRFHPPVTELELIVAHFDHRMRDSSAGDARWVCGLAGAWGLRVEGGSTDRVLSSEADARLSRYDFLERVRRDVGARTVVTAHHADDQAETVLFRLFRGTGVGGLQGIPESREPAVFRPFLSFWRDELEDHARSARLSWREDPSNRRMDLARNALRRRILPDVERLVAPGARRALVRLAGLADHEEAGWASVLPELMHALDVEEDAGRITVDRRELVRLHPAVRGRVLRSLANRLGCGLDAVGTGIAVEFAEAGRSGGRIDLGSFLELKLELDRVLLASRTSFPPDEPLWIPDPDSGSGEALLGGMRVPVAWGGEQVTQRARTEHFGADHLHFPLMVRARAPGDRIRLGVGTKKLKKLFLEARIPPSRRHQTPVVADSENEILWVPGVARVVQASDSAGAALGIGVG
jgi:tRNA(Ile)-lysidine synthase